MSKPGSAVTSETHPVTAQLRPGDLIYLLRLEYSFSGNPQATVRPLVIQQCSDHELRPENARPYLRRLAETGEIQEIRRSYQLAVQLIATPSTLHERQQQLIQAFACPAA